MTDEKEPVVFIGKYDTDDEVRLTDVVKAQLVNEMRKRRRTPPVTYPRCGGESK